MFQKFVIILGLFACLSHALIEKRITKKAVAAARLYNIEGVILPPDPLLRPGSRWPADITLSINGGEYQGFVRLDGSFIVSGVPPGSYVLYANHADIYFKPIRVEITQNGKIRGRKLSHIRPLHVAKLPYPLILNPIMRRKYFRNREQWNVLDYILSPMVLLMVVPLMLMLLLPRLINDPETKREIENIQFPKIPTGVPDLSDVVISLLTSKRPPHKEKNTIGSMAHKKRN